MALSKCAFFCLSNQIMFSSLNSRTAPLLFCSLLVSSLLVLFSEQQNSRTAEQRTTPGFLNSRTTKQQNNRTTEQQNNRTTEQHLLCSLNSRTNNTCCFGVEQNRQQQEKKSLLSSFIVQKRKKLTTNIGVVLLLKHRRTPKEEPLCNLKPFFVLLK